MLLTYTSGEREQHGSMSLGITDYSATNEHGYGLTIDPIAPQKTGWQQDEALETVITSKGDTLQGREQALSLAVPFPLLQIFPKSFAFPLSKLHLILQTDKAMDSPGRDRGRGIDRPQAGELTRSSTCSRARMLASSMECTCCSTQVPSTRSSSRSPRCLLRYTSLRSTFH
jgi:hypothetical protein